MVSKPVNVATSRYARQEALPMIGKEGQRKLSTATVAIVGCGALGSVSAELLCRAGIGKLVLIDHDIADITNLQRQALFLESDIGKPKAEALKAHLTLINNKIEIISKPEHLDAKNIRLLSGADCIIDGTDDIDTRKLINEYSRQQKIPWIYGGAVATRGFVYVTTKDTPCFSCIFPMIKQGESCEEAGILNSTSHIVASIQTAECIKMLIGKEKQSTKGLIHIDLNVPKIETFTVKKNQECPVCKGQYQLLKNKNKDKSEEAGKKTEEFTVQKCKTRAGWSARPKSQVKLDLNAIKKKFSVILDTPILIVVRKEGIPGDMIIHNYGEILFKELSDEKKIRKIAEEIYSTGKR
jgi:adenylyltransferase/sulfurtransferase